MVGYRIYLIYKYLIDTFLIDKSMKIDGLEVMVDIWQFVGFHSSASPTALHPS
jgi:hypothetical protein